VRRSFCFGGEVVTSRYFHRKAVLSTLDQLGKTKTHTHKETCKRHVFLVSTFSAQCLTTPVPAPTPCHLEACTLKRATPPDLNQGSYFFVEY
jgi:hypothetical protein